jgi:hypothetical protein
VTDAGEQTLFVPEVSALQLLNHPASADLRISMMSEALQAQIKIDHGMADPGLQSAGFDLISDATNWLLDDAPFVYSPVSGIVDTNHNGVLDAGATNTGVEYNTATQSFTTPPVKTTMAAGQNDVDVVSSTPHSGDLMASGNDLVSALTAFNAGELVTQTGGPQVGRETGGMARDIHANTATGFLTVLKLTPDLVPNRAIRLDMIGDQMSVKELHALMVVGRRFCPWRAVVDEGEVLAAGAQAAHGRRAGD